MTSLKEGDKAPMFTALNEKNELISLSSYLGKKVILYFYPKYDSWMYCGVMQFSREL